MKQTLISLDQREAWTAALEGIEHSFGHTWESCYAMYLTTRHPTYLYVFEQANARVVCPVSERKTDGHVDLVTPYGFSGFSSNAEVTDFQLYWKQFAREAGYVCGYIGLNPLFEKTSLLAGENASSHNTLFVLDLTLPLDVLFSNLSTNRKRQVKNMEKIQHLFTANKSMLTTFFIDHFHHFFSEKKASPVYNFSTETLSFLGSLDNVVFAGVEENGRIVAVSVFACTPFVVEYLFNISLPEGRQYAVPLIWWAVNYFHERQIPALNLGGGVKQEDSLTDFKARFGTKQLPLKSLKQVYEPGAFTALCQQYQVTPSTEGYFPPYRNATLIKTKSLSVSRI